MKAALLMPDVAPSLADTMSKATTIACFEHLRDLIAADLEVCNSMRDRAALYLRMSDCLKVLAELAPKAVEDGDAVDEIAARRAQRKRKTG